MKRPAVKAVRRARRSRSKRSVAAPSVGYAPDARVLLRDGDGLACTWLIIGYGNELRGDDAAGPHVARTIDELRLPGVYVLVRQQLTPELADQIAHVDAVIFVDAAVDVKTLTVREVQCAERADIVAHSNSPEVMLAFARAAFGHSPRAWLVSVPAMELGFRSTLTARTSRGAAEAVQRVMDLIKTAAV